MTKEHPTFLLRVEWRSDKKLIVTHITAIDEGGRPVALKVLSVTPEEPCHVSQDPEAWQKGFSAGRRGLPRKNPYPAGGSAIAWITGYLGGKAKPLRSVDEGTSHD